MGEFKDDQLQKIQGDINSTSDRGGILGGDGKLFKGHGNATYAGYTHDGSTNIGLTFDSTKVTRSGYDSNGNLVGSDVTHGKQMGVTYLIKVL